MRPVLAIVFALAAGPAAADVFIFEDIDVVSMSDERVLEDQYVVVRDGVIESVSGQPPEVEDDVTRIDGQGRYLMPGLAEMHAHIPPTDDRQLAEDVLFLYLSQGLTTVRGMLGRPAHLALREEAAAGEIDSPRIYTSGPSLNGNSVDSPEQAARMVRDQHAAGYDHIKIHPGLTREEFDALAAAANELGMPYVGHVSDDYGAIYAIEAGMTGIDHLDGFVAALVPDDSPAAGKPQGFFGLAVADAADRERIDDLVARIVDAGTWVVPTEALMVRLLGPRSTDALLADPGMEYLAPATREQWRQARSRFADAPRDTIERFLAIRRDLIAALNDAGANLMLGSDAPQVFNVPGFSAHQELAIYVDAGLSPFEALRTGTVNVARYVGAERRGQVREGFDADLIVLDANPLADVANSREIAGVMVAGRWYDRQALDQGLAAIRARVSD